MVRSGDIALLWFPFGSSQSSSFKKRPVLILNKSGTGDDQAVVCTMITGSADRIENPHPGDIAVLDWQAFGLAKESVVRPARFWSAEESDVDKVIGKATPEFPSEALEAEPPTWLVV
jgi:hypothetical protein